MALKLSSGVASNFITLNEGDNEIDVEVTAEDEETTKDLYDHGQSRCAVVNNHTPQRVVYIADRDTDEVFELYSVLDDGLIGTHSSYPVLWSTARRCQSVSKFPPIERKLPIMADQDTEQFSRIICYALLDGSSSSGKSGIEHVYAKFQIVCLVSGW